MLFSLVSALVGHHSAIGLSCRRRSTTQRSLLEKTLELAAWIEWPDDRLADDFNPAHINADRRELLGGDIRSQAAIAAAVSQRTRQAGAPLRFVVGHVAVVRLEEMVIWI